MKAIKLPPLQKWRKDVLNREDWDFKEFCDELEATARELPDADVPWLISRAIDWEIDRELGSGNGRFDLKDEMSNQYFWAASPRECELVVHRQSGPPSVTTIAQPFWFLEPRRKRQALHEWSLAELAPYVTADAFGVTRASNDVCVLEIPWTDQDDDIVEAFRSWLHKHRGAHVHRRAGRKYEWRTWWANLAIYRLSTAGYTRAETLSRLAQTHKTPNQAGVLPAPPPPQPSTKPTQIKANKPKRT